MSSWSTNAAAGVWSFHLYYQLTNRHRNATDRVTSPAEVHIRTRIMSSERQNVAPVQDADNAAPVGNRGLTLTQCRPTRYNPYMNANINL